MMNNLNSAIIFSSIFTVIMVSTAPATSLAEQPRPNEIEFFIPPLDDGSQNPDPFLASGVSIGKNVATYYTAGTGPAGGNNPGTEFPDPEFFVDPEVIEGFAGGEELPADITVTEAQGLNVVNRIKADLEENGLSLEDVIFLRIYLEAPEGADRADYAGWNRAYRRYFANVDRDTGQPIDDYDPIVVNETRPARSNIEVATLPVEGWLVEIEAVAAYAQEGDTRPRGQGNPQGHGGGGR
ncbi:hypothetical protein HC341_04130 [Aquisalimonas sp. 2447]|uniref:Rid family hydrolase n=1 Tax=Aquisalimonas sp. 2447 TaxID=2740807 RepID=UPI001432481D|nr:Rid family hydrolase [Aquisalimonas sp. 2447]QIT54474.1 hypothetical protein HC341_04130 [Aquisalimonas sp. 2447]